MHLGTRGGSKRLLRSLCVKIVCLCLNDEVPLPNQQLGRHGAKPRGTFAFFASSSSSNALPCFPREDRMFSGSTHILGTAEAPPPLLTWDNHGRAAGQPESIQDLFRGGARGTWDTRRAAPSLFVDVTGCAMSPQLQ